MPVAAGAAIDVGDTVAGAGAAVTGLGAGVAAAPPEQATTTVARIAVARWVRTVISVFSYWDAVPGVGSQDERGADSELIARAR
jgi:hypothetical protein